ncbi:uncharacterized protein PITG_02617 [Phytophthora infestans T30-4]|uniref:Uncharacterized protein n=1 Tax=Phytophthora infestans (strain T30-4) TaxID=403677 RepID=D0MWS8_PHYIT|nr:uncharacterized protein PITG_02617 [Phytophthora infestans T30-4]EEY64091.1 conserved hypothetical protein [Phytophthora infestans T30-4]|eukprot:XP_002907527.1 conserved hypothetical protein [Phytophthora infestans T30-4]
MLMILFPRSVTHLIPPDLTRRPRDKRLEASWTSNQHRAWLRANREDEFRAMHIVALIEGVERVLCSLRFYKETGLFCATPGFSAPIVDPENDPDLLIKGPKLSTYHISTPGGSLYEYVLDSMHDLLPLASSEDQRLSRDIRLQEEKRDFAEVSRWQLLSQDPKRGKTRNALHQRSEYPGCLTSVAFGWHQHFNLKLVKDEALNGADEGDDDIVPCPVLHLSVYSRDSWRRKRTQGHGEIKLGNCSGFYDSDVPIRKPITSISDQMEELFLGIDESIEDVELTRGQLREVNTDDSPLSTMITSRLGQKSESTGTTVRVRCNIVDLQPSKHPSIGRLSSAPMATSVTNTRIVKRSVQEILQSVKLEKRLASITDPRIQAALRSLPIDKGDLV